MMRTVPIAIDAEEVYTCHELLIALRAQLIAIPRQTPSLKIKLYRSSHALTEELHH